MIGMGSRSYFRPTSSHPQCNISKSQLSLPICAASQLLREWSRDPAEQMCTQCSTKYCLAALRSSSLCLSIPFLLHAEFATSILPPPLRAVSLPLIWRIALRRFHSLHVISSEPVTPPWAASLPNTDPIASLIPYHHPVHLRSIALPERKLRRICFAKHHSPLLSASP
jgi:hypothetical protein